MRKRWHLNWAAQVWFFLTSCDWSCYAMSSYKWISTYPSCHTGSSCPSGEGQSVAWSHASLYMQHKCESKGNIAPPSHPSLRLLFRRKLNSGLRSLYYWKLSQSDRDHSLVWTAHSHRCIAIYWSKLVLASRNLLLSIVWLLWSVLVPPVAQIYRHQSFFL